MGHELTRFDWDDGKAVRNVAKHGVTFEEAATVFDDPLAAIASDPDHSFREWWELAVGRSLAGRLLLVSFTETGSLTRIISARELTATERRSYEEKTFP